MKLVLSDNLAPMVNEVFASPARFHPSDIWIASLAFGFQIYLDFAGYTDIARGVARLFGFEFEVNFLYPMAAANIADHWNRWHISLTTWLRDYLYIPLGGSRVGRVRTYLNILAVWLFAGIWHGPAYHFIAWGLWQWVMISAHRVFSGSAAHRWINRRGGIPYDLFSRVITIFCLIFGFIWFRAETLTIATRMQGMLFGISDLPAIIAGRSPSAAPISVPVHTPYIALLALLFLYDYVMKRFQIEYFLEDRNRNKLVGLLTGMIAAILILSSPESSDFLYFQF
jgi:D-alanyl-lipoteichoic acid acyltransferase DltB (MBOAT superfamily)